MANKAAKGPQFERWFSEELSRWWTNGERTDVFWRTSNSGGRATIRGKLDKATSGQYGDIAAIDPIGQPLIRFLTIELKRGYSRATVADLLDKPAGAKVQTYEEWFQKAEGNHKAAGSLFWMLIHKRDRREPIVFLPEDFLRSFPCFCESKIVWGGMDTPIACFPLKVFFEDTRPERIKERFANGL